MGNKNEGAFTESNELHKVLLNWAPCLYQTLYTVHEHSDQALGLLTQEHEVSHYGLQLDPGAREYPDHLKAVAAAAKTAETSSELVQGGIVNLQVPHAVQNLLNTERTQDFSVSRLTYYESLLLSPSNRILDCNSLNSATLLSLCEKGEAHNYVELISQILTPRLDL